MNKIKKTKVKASKFDIRAVESNHDPIPSMISPGDPDYSRLLLPKKIEYPSNWIEAVKQRFAPQWLLEKYPVKLVKLYVWTRQTSYQIGALSEDYFKTWEKFIDIVNDNENGFAPTFAIKDGKLSIYKGYVSEKEPSKYIKVWTQSVPGGVASSVETVQ